MLFQHQYWKEKFWCYGWYVLDTYTPSGVSGSPTHECVVAKNGSTIVGRYDIQTKCNTYYTNGQNNIINAGGSKSYTANNTYTVNQYVTTVTVNVPTMLLTVLFGLIV